LRNLKILINLINCKICNFIT